MVSMRTLRERYAHLPTERLAAIYKTHERCRDVAADELARRVGIETTIKSVDGFVIHVYPRVRVLSMSGEENRE